MRLNAVRLSYWERQMKTETRVKRKSRAKAAMMGQKKLIEREKNLKKKLCLILRSGRSNLRT